MQAPDYDTLFRQEEQIENAVKTILTAEGLDAYTQRDIRYDANGNIVSLPTPRVDVQLALGPVYDLHMSPDRAGNLWYDAWTATLTCAIVTKRTKNNDQHGLMRAQIRRLMQCAAGKLTEAVLPHHKLSKIVEHGTAPTVKTQDDCDDSAVTFSCIVAVRGDAWPAV